MDVEGSDQRGELPLRASRRELRDRPPGPELSTHVRLYLPVTWPEVVTYRAGYRLAQAEEDTVSELLRLGGEVTAWLSHEEIEAQLTLAGPAWERWLRWGWWCWELDQEER